MQLSSQDEKIWLGYHKNQAIMHVNEYCHVQWPGNPATTNLLYYQSKNVLQSVYMRKNISETESSNSVCMSFILEPK